MRNKPRLRVRWCAGRLMIVSPPDDDVEYKLQSGRPRIGDRPMTPAERKRRQRAKEREGTR